MKFIALIASAMLVALIGQYSVMGLPLNNTLICSQGMELIDGRCVLSSSYNTSIGYENSTRVTDILPPRTEASYTELTPVRIFGSCPNGMQHGEHGICEKIQTSTSNEFNVPTTTEFLNHSTTEFRDWSVTTERADVSTTTERVGVSTTTELNKPSTRQFIVTSTTPAGNIEATTEFVDQSTTTELNTPSTRRFKGKSATLPTTAGTPSAYDELTTTATQFTDVWTTTELNTPATRTSKGKLATLSTTTRTPSDYDELTTTTELNTPSTRRFKGKSATLPTATGTPSDYDELTTTTELNTPSTRKYKGKSATLSTTIGTPSDYDELTTTTELNIPSTRKYKGKSATLPTTIGTPSDYDELTTTTERNENVGGVDNIKGCPKGTQPDEDGACVLTQPINSTKVITNPKVLLVNGSCPIDYKMIEGRCLYIKSKKNSTLYQTGSSMNGFQTGARAKSGINSQSEDELVPVLGDNSCPEGTEYSEFGLCRKRIQATTPRLISTIKSQDGCADGYQFVNGKCVHISQLARSKSTLGMISTTTPFEEESAYENHVEDTSSPL